MCVDYVTAVTETTCSKERTNRTNEEYTTDRMNDAGRANERNITDGKLGKEVLDRIDSTNGMECTDAIVVMSVSSVIV
jgi:hypothetical protein